MRKVTTDRAPAAIGPYTQAVVAGGLVFTSAQVALDPLSGRLAGGDDAGAQAVRALENIAAVLEAAGSGTEQALKVTVFLRRMSDYATVNAVYERYFPGRPARTTVAVSELPAGALVAFDCLALAGENTAGNGG